MAFAIDTKTMRSTGNCFQVSGTYTSATSDTQEDLFPNGYILSFSVDRNESDDDMVIPLVKINASDQSTADNGSISHQDSTAGDTIAWTASFIM